MKNEKPQLGVIPEKLFEEHRVQELSEAINRYVSHIDFHSMVIDWAEELIKRIDMINGLRNMEKNMKHGREKNKNM